MTPLVTFRICVQLAIRVWCRPRQKDCHRQSNNQQLQKKWLSIITGL